MNIYGQPVRGEYDATPAANTPTPITLFNTDGTVRTLGPNEQLAITDVSYRCTAASTLRVYYDQLGDGSFSQPASPTVGHTPAGTGIAAGTPFFYYTYYDPRTNSETVRSTSQSVTNLAGDSITVTAPNPVPAYMKDAQGNQGFIKVYFAGTGLVGQSAPGTVTVTLTSLAALGPESATSGGSASGKQIGGAFLPANGFWSDCFETPKFGPPGVLPKFQSTVSTPVMVHISGGIIQQQA